MFENFRAKFERLPLIGGLAQCRSKDYGEPIKEFCFTWCVSFLPILASVFIELVKSPPEPGKPLKIVNIFCMIYSNLNTGEVFIYATAMLAPVAFLMYKYNRDEIRLHNHLSFLFLVIVTIAVSALMFGLQKGAVIQNKQLMDVSGLALYILALFIWFLSLVYDNLRLDYPRFPFRPLVRFNVHFEFSPGVVGRMLNIRRSGPIRG